MTDTAIATDTVPEAKKPKKAKETAKRYPGQKKGWTVIFNYTFLILLALLYIYPFILSVATSFKSDEEATNAGMKLWSSNWTTAAYHTLFQNSDFPLWLKNSFVVAVFVTAGRVFFDSLAGYALSRLNFIGRNVLFAGLIAVMAVPGVVLMIPKFLVVNQFGMYDAWSGMIIPLLVDATGVFIMANFFKTIPVAIEEAARVDGAGTFTIFWSIVLPMARPALVTIFIMSFQGSWNELTHFIVTTQSPELTVLTKGVAALTSGQLGSGNQYPLKLAGAMVMTIPVAIVFLIFQKRIMSNSAGGVKE